MEQIVLLILKALQAKKKKKKGITSQKKQCFSFRVLLSQIINNNYYLFSQCQMDHCVSSIYLYHIYTKLNETIQTSVISSQEADFKEILIKLAMHIDPDIIC